MRDHKQIKITNRFNNEFSTICNWLSELSLFVDLLDLVVGNAWLLCFQSKGTSNIFASKHSNIINTFETKAMSLIYVFVFKACDGTTKSEKYCFNYKLKKILIDNMILFLNLTAKCVTNSL